MTERLKCREPSKTMQLYLLNGLGYFYCVSEEMNWHEDEKGLIESTSRTTIEHPRTIRICVMTLVDYLNMLARTTLVRAGYQPSIRSFVSSFLLLKKILIRTVTEAEQGQSLPGLLGHFGADVSRQRRRYHPTELAMAPPRLHAALPHIWPIRRSRYQPFLF